MTLCTLESAICSILYAKAFAFKSKKKLLAGITITGSAMINVTYFNTR